VQGAAISPDGSEAVYIASGNSSDRVMWKVSTAGSDARPLFNLGTSYLFGWSPDGANILYSGGPGISLREPIPANTPVAGSSLWLTDPDGRNSHPLYGPFLFGWGFYPVWSPDSQWVAYTGQDTGLDFECAKKKPAPDPRTCRFAGTAVYAENVLTGQVRRLAAGIEPAWSPDGSRLSFLSNRSGAPEVWSIGVDGSGLQQLTSDGQPKWQVMWVPNRR
jgi:TolB protein